MLHICVKFERNNNTTFVFILSIFKVLISLMTDPLNIILTISVYDY